MLLAYAGWASLPARELGSGLCSSTWPTSPTPAWRKRLVSASLGWLAWLLSEVVAGPPLPPTALPAPARRIWLIDGSTMPQPGGAPDAWRLHAAYDLLAGRLSQLRLTDHHQAEGLAHYVLQAGDIVVADRGYGYRKHLVYAVGQEADVVLRMDPRGFPLETADGTPFDVLNWSRSGHGEVRERWLTCQYRGRRYRVRLVALQAPPQHAARARARKRRQASRSGRKLTPHKLFLAGWVLLVTTLAAAWSARDVGGCTERAGKRN